VLSFHRPSRRVTYALLAAACLLVTAVLGSLALTRSSVVWYIRITGVRVVANGKPVSGYVDRCANDGRLILTRAKGDGSRESYMIGPPSAQKDPDVAICRGWIAPRLMAFPTSIYNPPCWGALSERGGLASWPAVSESRGSTKLGLRSVAFFAGDGEYLEAYWR
jgi:hypothetical protein